MPFETTYYQDYFFIVQFRVDLEIGVIPWLNIIITHNYYIHVIIHTIP